MALLLPSLQGIRICGDALEGKGMKPKSGAAAPHSTTLPRLIKVPCKFREVWSAALLRRFQLPRRIQSLRHVWPVKTRDPI